MMKTVFFFLLFFIAASLPAQDTMRITTHYKNGKLNESYLLNAKGQKEGEYIRYNHFGKKQVSGQYTNGNPTGTWQYFRSDSSGALVQTLDFDQHKELFVDSQNVHTLICGPRYFGGSLLEHEYIQNRVKSDFTSEEQALYKGQTFTVSFTIDSTTYKPVGISVDNDKLNAATKAKLLKIIAEMPAWLPPVCKSKENVWRFSVGVGF